MENISTWVLHVVAHLQGFCIVLFASFVGMGTIRARDGRALFGSALLHWYVHDLLTRVSTELPRFVWLFVRVASSWWWLRPWISVTLIYLAKLSVALSVWAVS